jgi:hypothetical protein
MKMFTIFGVFIVLCFIKILYQCTWQPQSGINNVSLVCLGAILFHLMYKLEVHK